MDIVDRFLKYVSFPTTSVDDCETIPSNPDEFKLRDFLADELRELGAEAVICDEFCYLYATIPGNVPGAPSIGLLAHLDTSSSASGENIHPQRMVRDGKKIICTDGTTLLGGDDKAGMAAIMSAVEYLHENPDYPHGELRIVFTPDEEVGQSTEKLDLVKLGTDFAYTVDGGDCREVEAENMWGHTVKVTVTGASAHPGYAKGVLKPAHYIGMEYAMMLPQGQRSEFTEGREDFHYLAKFDGMAKKSELIYFIRSATADGLQAQVDCMNGAADFLNVKYGPDTVKVEILSDRKNMMEDMKDNLKAYELACAAVKKVCGEVLTPICRGGFDGMVVTAGGIPCPNLGAGDYNMHAVDEYVVVDEMRKSMAILLEIMKQSAV